VEHASAKGRRRAPVVVTIGNPNTGKSTVFNALTGLRQRVGNYPGVTVEKTLGTMRLPIGEVMLVDLPGTYSLSAQSPDEMVAVDVLQGQMSDIGLPDAVLLVADAANLRRNLFLASQVLELGLPVVIALNMADVAARKTIAIDAGALEEALEARVVPLIASEGIGFDALREALDATLRDPRAPAIRVVPEFREAALDLAAELNVNGRDYRPYELERALIDVGGYAEQRLLAREGAGVRERLAELRLAIGKGRNLATLEARDRYGWIARVLEGVERRGEAASTLSDRIDRVVNHPLIGSLLFILVMAVVFQSVFAWALPLMDAIDAGAAAGARYLSERLPPGALSSLATDGVIAGVGSVVIFLPQIVILFAFIILLEDTGYMARAAFLMDRLMRWCGLSGQSFIPMLSSFACAVPGIMGTRVIGNPRDRIATILAAPFMTCSARLPVYALLIAAFIPRTGHLGGLVNLQGLVLLGLYLLGIVGGVATAFLLKRTVLRGPTPAFLMEMPDYRLPSLRSMLYKLWARARIFLTRAGTVIFSVAVIVWALAYFPRTEPPAMVSPAHAEAGGGPAARTEIERQVAAWQLEQSYLGTIGKFVAPVFAPLGWDWKVSSAVIASFPAREVVIAVLGTVYAVGDDVDAADESLVNRIKQSTHADGRPVFTVAMAVGLMLFYAFCLQCASTVAIMRRETNSWRWPIFAWCYMTGLGYLFALLCFQLGS
jgi:ferrous iron transport protein B